MRLIDADVLKYVKFHGVTDWTPTEETSYQRGWNDAIGAIMRNAPTVDAVEVVRCKDCSSWGTITIVIDNNKSIVACDCLDFGTLTKPDFFCAWGEKGDVDRTKSGKMNEVEE